MEIRQTRWGEMGGVRKSGGERGESEDPVDGRVRVKRLRARSGKVDGEVITCIYNLNSYPN